MSFLTSYPINKIKLIAISFILSLIIGIIFSSASTYIHESFHTVLLRFIGCKATFSSKLIIGETGFNCKLSDLEWILISLVAPLSSFTFGVFLWFKYGKDSLARFIGFFLQFISGIISLSPFVAGSDMWVAIQHGFNSVIAWIIYLLASSIFYHNLLTEIIDREIIKL